MICKHFLSHMGYLFTLLMVSFAMQKLFNLMVDPPFTFAFVAFALIIKTKKVITKTDIKEVTVDVFFWCSNGFRSYVNVFNPSQVDFCLWCKIKIQFHSFACSFPKTIYRRLSFPHGVFLASLM